MRVLILGDPHIGKGLSLGKQGIGHALNSRIVDQINLLDWVYDRAIDEEVKKVIITGDCFEDPKPHPTIISLFFSWLKKCTSSNIQVHIVLGNHDLIRSGAFNMSALDLISASDLEDVFFHKDIDTIHMDGLSFTLLPFRDRRSFNTNSNSEALDILGKKIPYEIRSIDRDSLKLLVGHLAIEGSIFVGDEIDDMANELFCPLSMFNEYDFTLNGHVHKPQVLSKLPYIAHIGSMDISDFGEANHSKVIAIIDAEAPKPLRHMELPTRPLRQVSISVPENIANSTEYVLSQLDNVDCKQAIARVSVVFENPNVINIDRSLIEDKLYANGAFHITRIVEERRIESIKKDASNAIDNTVDEIVAIKMYATDNVDDELRDEFVSIAVSIVDEHMQVA